MIIIVVLLLASSLFSVDSDSILVIFDAGGGGGEIGWADDGSIVRLTTETDSVGIGTNTPMEKLDINGRIRMSQQPATTPTTDKLYNIGGDLFWNGAQLTGGGGILPTGTSGQTLRYSGSGWSAVDNLYNDGTNIGIGTINPVDDETGAGGTNGIAKLHIRDITSGAYPKVIIDGPINGGSALQFMTDGISRSDIAYNSNLNRMIFSNRMAEGPIYFNTHNGTSLGTRFIINDDGKVAIGTVNPEYNLHIYENSTAGAFLGFEDISGKAEIHTYSGNLYFDVADDGADMAILNDGNVGIGTTSPQEKLHIVGNITQQDNNMATQRLHLGYTQSSTPTYIELSLPQVWSSTTVNGGNVKMKIVWRI